MLKAALKKGLAARLRNIAARLDPPDAPPPWIPNISYGSGNTVANSGSATCKITRTGPAA